MKFKLLVTGIYIKWGKKEQRIVDHHFFLFNRAPYKNVYPSKDCQQKLKNFEIL